MNREESNNLIQVLVLSAVLLIILILIPQFIGLGKSGFYYSSSTETGTVDFNFILFQYLFYAGPGIGFLLGLLVIFAIEIIIRKGDNKYGNGIGFHSPEIKYFQGWSGMIKLIFLSLIIFGILGLYTAYTHNTFTGIATLKHQFTFFDNILFSAALVPAAENLGAAFFFGFLVLFLRFFARKVNMSKEGFYVLFVLLAIVAFLTYGYVNHQLRYGFNEVALITVIFFWGLGGLLTAVSGSFIPFWIMHIINNLFYELGNKYSGDIFITYAIGAIIGVAILYVLLFVRRKK